MQIIPPAWAQHSVLRGSRAPPGQTPGRGRFCMTDYPMTLMGSWAEVAVGLSGPSRKMRTMAQDGMEEGTITDGEGGDKEICPRDQEPKKI